MKSKVYFNNSCSICRFEINHYKKITSNIDWIDISSNKNTKKDTNLDERYLLRRLHLFKNNTLYSGIDAFIELWIEIPRYKILGNFLKKPVIYQISWIFYEIIAIILFFKNKNQLNKLERLYNE
tara:strand:+ start:202 stop:573 length:372 start_codon:yes stop_codon:yes gene_type:complete